MNVRFAVFHGSPDFLLLMLVVMRSLCSRALNVWNFLVRAIWQVLLSGTPVQSLLGLSRTVLEIAGAPKTFGLLLTTRESPA